MMPELNETIQEGYERAIFKSLVLGLLYGRIKCVETQNTKTARSKAGGRAAGASGVKYKYEFWRTNSRTPTPLNCLGNYPCDSFYKLADVLTSNPLIVQMINDAVKYEIEKDRARNVTLENSMIMKGLNRLTMPELTGDSSKKVSIFGVAMAIKAMTPPDLFIEEHGLLLLDVIIDTLFEQMDVLCHEEERDEKFLALIQDQYELFKNNMDFYTEKYPNVLDNYLAGLLQVVIVFMNKHGFYDVADEFTELKETVQTVKDSGNAEEDTEDR
jgi:hypothetical protein